MKGEYKRNVSEAEDIQREEREWVRTPAGNTRNNACRVQGRENHALAQSHRRGKVLHILYLKTSVGQLSERYRTRVRARVRIRFFSLCVSPSFSLPRDRSHLNLPSMRAVSRGVLTSLHARVYMRVQLEIYETCASPFVSGCAWCERATVQQES